MGGGEEEGKSSFRVGEGEVGVVDQRVGGEEDGRVGDDHAFHSWL